MNIAEYWAKLLVKNGIDAVFGIPSYVGMQLLGAFVKEGMKVELNAHEQNATHMAEGYFYATGRAAVVSVAIGPGLSNAMTGIANAYVESVPMIVVAARASKQMLGRNEYHANTGIGRTLNERQMISSCTKAAFYIESVDDAKTMLAMAFTTAVSDRPGPVFVSIPPELQLQEIDNVDIVTIEKTSEEFSKEGITQAVDLWNKAKYPLLMLGKGVRQMDKELLGSFLQDNVPYFSSYGAKGYVPLLPNYLGTAWYCNSEQIVAAVDQADLILALGEDFTHFTIGIFNNNEYEIKKPIIQVHEYKEELNRTYKSKAAIHMQVSDFIAEAILVHDGFSGTAWSNENTPWAFADDMIALGHSYTNGWAIHVKSSRSSRVNFWVGMGVLWQRGEEYILGILSYEQYEKMKGGINNHKSGVFDTGFANLRSVSILG